MSVLVPIAGTPAGEPGAPRPGHQAGIPLLRRHCPRSGGQWGGGPHRTPHGSGKGPRRAELLAAISLAIDLGLGQPMEHMLRSSMIATRIAERMSFDAQQRATVYYANLVGGSDVMPIPTGSRSSSATTSPSGPTPTRST